MNLTRDTYEHILNFVNDSTLLNMLSVNKKFRDEKLFEKIMNRRYSDLIKYRKENETFINLYIRMVYFMAKLKEDFGILFDVKFGNPETFYNLYQQERLQFAMDADNWHGNMEPGKDFPFDLEDPNHYSLRKIRKSIVDLGGKIIPQNELASRARVVSALSHHMLKNNLFQKLGYNKYYKELANRLKRFDINE